MISMTSFPADSNVHDRFFFADGSLYLKVEDTLYCVHKFLFEIHATTFPVPERQTSLTNPYVLEDVKKADFDRLLAHLYPRTLGVEETKTSQDWISILALASKWGFDSLRPRAIAKIEKTLDSPIDMVTLGRQYAIASILLPGYAVLCQSTTPLTYEEGQRLGMEDVVNIYRIRHELYGSGITPVPLEAVFAKVQEAGMGAEYLGHESYCEQGSIWTDAVSLNTSQIFAEDEKRGSIILMPDGESFPEGVAARDAVILMSEQPPHLSSDNPTSAARGNDVSSSAFPRNPSNLNSASSESAREVLRLIEELTDSNFDLVSVEIMRWVNTKDTQTLHRITQMIVEKAIKEFEAYQSGPFTRLCKMMAKYNRPMHEVTRLIVEKAMEERRQFYPCASLCDALVKKPGAYGDTIVTASGLLFGEYLGEICQKNLEVITASVTSAGDHTARVRRLHLIEFIGQLADFRAIEMWAPTIIDKWVTALLDDIDEEKVATLCMAMTRIGRLCTSQHLNQWLQSAKNVAEETSNPRVRTLLQSVSVTKHGWVVSEPSEDCAVQ